MVQCIMPRTLCWETYLLPPPSCRDDDDQMVGLCEGERKDVPTKLAGNRVSGLSAPSVDTPDRSLGLGDGVDAFAGICTASAFGLTSASPPTEERYSIQNQLHKSMRSNSPPSASSSASTSCTLELPSPSSTSTSNGAEPALSSTHSLSLG